MQQAPRDFTQLSGVDAIAIRLQQMHPAAVHLPITLLPLAVGADLLGCLTGNRSLHSFGRKAIAVAAVGAVASAVTGLIGKLVYEAGAGVEPAHGVYRPDAPALGDGPPMPFFKTAAIDLWHGVQHMAREVRQGKIVPTLVALCRKKFAARPDTSTTTST